VLPSDGGTSGLFLSPVPIPPGDPAALASGAATYTAAQGEIERSRATLASVTGQAGGAAWTGAGASGFVTSTSTLASAYSVTSGALAQGATALRAYSADLAAAQATARQANAAVAQTNATASALLTAQSDAQTAQASANDAANASAAADAHAAANPHSPGAQVAATNARTTASDASTAASGAWQRVTALTGTYDAQRSHAVTLSAQATSQATHASAKAAAAFSAASSSLTTGKSKPGQPSVWQKIVSGIPVWNDRAGWGLNAWGAFGALVVGKAEAKYLEAASTLNGARAAEDQAFWNWYEGDGGWFNWNPARLAYNSAASNASTAAEDLRGAIAPAASDWGAMAVLGRAGLGLGMASDVVTMWQPTASFGPGGLLGGNTDRVMAGLNFAASGLALGSSLGIGAAAGLMAIPGVDVVVGAVVIGTAAYFAGEFVYQHWGDITHGIEAAGSWLGNEATSLGNNIASGVTSAGSWVGHEASSVGSDIGKAFSWL
jgi:trimeric autotransporter adhesin